jgi:hypothetical protein
LIPGAGLNNLIDIWYAFPILVACGLLPWENNLTSGCHWGGKTANFSPPPCPVTIKGCLWSAPPQDRQIKIQKPVLWGGLQSAHYKKKNKKQ